MTSVTHETPRELISVHFPQLRTAGLLAASHGQTQAVCGGSDPWAPKFRKWRALRLPRSVRGEASVSRPGALRRPPVPAGSQALPPHRALGRGSRPSPVNPPLLRCLGQARWPPGQVTLIPPLAITRSSLKQDTWVSPEVKAQLHPSGPRSYDTREWEERAGPRAWVRRATKPRPPVPS